MGLIVMGLSIIEPVNPGESDSPGFMVLRFTRWMVIPIAYFIDMLTITTCFYRFLGLTVFRAYSIYKSVNTPQTVVRVIF